MFSFIAVQLPGLSTEKYMKTVFYLASVSLSLMPRSEFPVPSPDREGLNFLCHRAIFSKNRHWGKFGHIYKRRRGMASAAVG